ncbi:hypothetical protein [Geobacter sp.]|uniref:hypothetical protein n=1 Tax=Geobacter sp. TaxID=46610 RepID=UPI002631486D|nr:hypothetical protein [Geobacter sp.]
MAKAPKETVEKLIASQLPEDVKREDFLFVLQELLNAYRPILEEDLALIRSAERLLEETEKHPHTCEDEQLMADRIFAPLGDEKVALRLLDPKALELLGPIDQWRWCLRKILCCLRFGWLLSRARTFPAAVYYLYRYWLCIRRLFDDSIGSRPLTAAERADFRSLVGAFAAVFKPSLEREARAAERAGELADEAVAGKIDCHAGAGEAESLFERFMTVENARFLLGAELFEKLRQERAFWFCRCWCLCAFRFGWCLARSRTFFDLVRCLIDYFRCLRRCLQPLTCLLTKPTGCTEEFPNPNGGGLVVEIDGTATGGGFDHYTLEWRKVEGAPCADDTGWQATGISYPGSGATGTAPVVAGTLGWLDTTALPAGSYEIRLCVYSALPGVPRCCTCIQFSLFKRLVWIDRLANAPVQTPPGPFVSTAPIVSGNPGGVVVPVGGCVTVKGSAFVGECNNRKIKCFDLRFGLGWLPGPGELGFNPADYTGSLLFPYGPVCYPDPNPTVELWKRAQWNQVIERALTTHFVETEVEFLGSKFKVWKLQDFCFNSAGLLPVGVNDGSGCPDPHHRCRSGKYTLLLQVEDTLGNLFYDTQQVWFDNKPMQNDVHVAFTGIEGLPGCSDLKLSQFVPGGAPCGAPWPRGLFGIAYDEYIDETDMAYPSDNFDYYTLSITRQGGPTLVVPITPDFIAYGTDPLRGTQRVGQPGVRCEPLPAVGGCPAPPLVPARQAGLLTLLDLRIFDAVCAPSIPAAEHYTVPAGFSLKRGECCGYTFQLYARDKTWSDGWNGGYHHAWSSPWAVCICNDLRSEEG